MRTFIFYLAGLCLGYSHLHSNEPYGANISESFDEVVDVQKFVSQSMIYYNENSEINSNGGTEFGPVALKTTMPSLGDVESLHIIVEFADYNLNNPAGDSSDEPITLEEIRENILGGGTDYMRSRNTAKDSLYSFYHRASNGRLRITGDVVLVTLPLNRSEYEGDGTYTAYEQKNKSFIPMIFEMLDDKLDYTKYDNNGDSIIDSFNIMYCGPAGGFWSPGIVGGTSNSGTRDGVKIFKYSWQTLQIMNGKEESNYNPTILIHEVGHLLGLPDVYDYDHNTGPRGAAGLTDVMGGTGGLNGFFKWALGWVEPTLISSGAPKTVEIGARSDVSLDADKRCYVVWPEIAENDYLKEIYMVENFQKVDNDVGLKASNGLCIWHIDGALKTNGLFEKNNHRTDIKLIHPEQADGLETLALEGGNLENDDLFVAGDSFSPWSTPNSNAYDGTFTGLIVTNISESGTTMTADIGFVDNFIAPSSLASGDIISLYSVQGNSFINCDFDKRRLKSGVDTPVSNDEDNTPYNTKFVVKMNDDSTCTLSPFNEQTNQAAERWVRVSSSNKRLTLAKKESRASAFTLIDRKDDNLVNLLFHDKSTGTSKLVNNRNGKRLKADSASKNGFLTKNQYKILRHN